MWVAATLNPFNETCAIKSMVLKFIHFDLHTHVLMSDILQYATNFLNSEPEILEVLQAIQCDAMQYEYQRNRSGASCNH